MQNINVNDIFPERIPKNSTDSLAHTSQKKEKPEENIKVSENLSLRNINIDNPIYGQKDVKSIAEDIQSRIDSGQSELSHKNNMVLAASNMTEQDFSEMKKDGFSPEDLEEDAIVTVADKIKIQLAKGGMDVSAMGGISDAALEAVSISEGTSKYLIQNNLEPTIENIYKANHSISEKYDYSNAMNPGANISEEEYKELLPQIENIIKDAGYSVNDETLNGAKWLIYNKIPLTVDNLGKYMDLSEGYIKTVDSIDKKAQSIVDSLEEISDIQLENAVKKREPITIASVSAQSDIPVDASKLSLSTSESKNLEYEMISAKRALEEVRLSMTLEVSFSMTMRGIKVDTKPLSELVEDLKAEETKLYESLFGDNVANISKEISFEEKIEIYEQTNSTVALLKNRPAALLSSVDSLDSLTLRALSNQSVSSSAKYKTVENSYEALMTSPRKDLGDSIKKAFRNVDDILEDLGFEKTKMNERAVRILGYNSLSITKESVLQMRVADEAVQRTFKNLTPGVVAQMVKTGENPLDMSLDDLNKKIYEIKNEYSITSDEEEYAKFLYNLDRTKELSQEERNAYVGIYRLLHQVTKSDGAVIGALLNQGADITLRNMMMAVRSSNHKNREAVIDDSFGEIKEYKVEDLSITQQIEMVFMTARTRDAKESITPSKLSQFENENTYLDMTPDRFAEALEAMGEDMSEDIEYIKEQKALMEQAVSSEEKVYQALRQFDIPISPANLRAMEGFLSDRNNVYRKVFSRTVSEEDMEKTPEELMADIMRRFGEAVKTPEDMADAQEKLAETAENVMKSMMVEENVGYIDIKGMKASVTAIRMLGTIASQNENYTIPITVADENGTLNLRIVRGSNENNGLVNIAFNMDKTGPVQASFKVSAAGVSGSINAVERAVLNLIKDKEDDIISSVNRITGLDMNIEYFENRLLNSESVYTYDNPDFDTTKERSDVSTKTLYTLAKSFIDILGEI